MASSTPEPEISKAPQGPISAPPQSTVDERETAGPAGEHEEVGPPGSFSVQSAMLSGMGLVITFPGLRISAYVPGLEKDGTAFFSLDDYAQVIPRLEDLMRHIQEVTRDIIAVPRTSVPERATRNNEWNSSKRSPRNTPRPFTTRHPLPTHSAPNSALLTGQDDISNQQGSRTTEVNNRVRPLDEASMSPALKKLLDI
ncbi:hypothetical protein K445DRAFT_16236 [Daldinia sp. EC12]|nr:hypothetical protein K445DRAFT_16236 [Daldinia sp. EC12]